MRKLIFAMLALAASLIAPSFAQEQARGKTQEAAAAQGLALLQALAADKSRELGMSASDAARATLGKPLAVASVDLTALAAFKPSDDAAGLIRPAAAAFYPVVTEGSVRSGIRVENTGTGWEAARVGNAGLATAVDRARHALPAPDEPATLVQVLALNLVFVGQRSSDGWLLAPVIDDASVELKLGRAEPAAAVFTRLAPLAARHNGEPT